MTLGHKMRKINHSFWIRAQIWNWRPVEPPWCLLSINSISGKTRNFAIFLTLRLSNLASITYFDKQKFLRHQSSWKNANPEYFGHGAHIECGEVPKVRASAILEHFWKQHIFDILDFSRKLTIGPNDLGGTRETLSWLDLWIPQLDISLWCTGNSRF